MNLAILVITLLLINIIHCQKERILGYHSYSRERESNPNEKYLKLNTKCYKVEKNDGFLYHCNRLIHLIQSKESISAICSKNAGEKQINNITTSVMNFSTTPIRFLELKNCPSNYIGYYLEQDYITLEEVHITCRNYNDSLQRNLTLTKLQQLKSLRIDCPTWKELPEAMFYGKMINLTDLHISRTQIERLDDGVFEKLYKLRQLLLENNRIKSLKSSHFEALINLSKLTMIEPHLNAIDGNIFQNIPNIDYLHIDKWNMSRLPNGFQLLNLKSLNIFKTSLTRINAGECANFTNLTNLNIEDNELLSIDPDCFSYLKNIEVFRVSGNKNSGFPNKTLRWEILKEFHISDMVWENCDEGEIISGRRIKYVVMRNVCKQILNPSFIISITGMSVSSKLITMDLSGNHLQSLPIFPNNIKVQKMILSNNKLDFFPANASAAMSQARELHLNGNLLRDHVAQHPYFPFLEVLNLAGNSINSIPTLTIPEIKFLNLSNNRIEYYIDYHSVEPTYLIIPSSTRSGLLNLRTLDLSFNSFQYPPEVREPISTLYVDGNNLSILYMHWICTMEHLQNLFIRECNISRIIPYSNCVKELPLKILDLSHNHIKSNSWIIDYDNLWKTIGRYSPFVVLRNLEELYLGNNEIEDIPMDMRNMMPKLRRLDLRYNRIKYLNHHDLLYTSSQVFLNGSVTAYDQELYLTVDLRSNSIQGVELPHHMLIRNLTHLCDHHRYSLTSLLLDDNPVNCGCEIIPLMKVIEGDVVLASELWREDKKDWVLQAKLVPGNLKCRYPESVRGKKLLEPETWMHHLMPTNGFCHSVGFLGEEN